MSPASPDKIPLAIETIFMTIEVSLFLESNPHFTSLTGETFYLEDGTIDEAMTHGRYID